MHQVSGCEAGSGTLVEESTIVLEELTQTITCILSAYCLEFDKVNPSTPDTFTLLGPPDPSTRA